MLAVTAVGTVSAFVASLPSVVSSNTQLKLASDRVQEAIQAAQEASTNYGPTSPEARCGRKVSRTILHLFLLSSQLFV